MILPRDEHDKSHEKILMYYYYYYHMYIILKFLKSLKFFIYIYPYKKNLLQLLNSDDIYKSIYI
jgi:hypothetical protein